LHGIKSVKQREERENKKIKSGGKREEKVKKVESKNRKPLWHWRDLKIKPSDVQAIMPSSALA
jgi:hypothetical protein